MSEMPMDGLPDDSLARALGLLRRAAIRVVDGNLDRVLLVLPDHTQHSSALHFGRRSPTPARIAKDIAAAHEDRVLYLVPTPGQSVLKAAAAGHVDLVSTNPDRIIIGGTPYISVPETRAVRTGRNRWGRWAVERVLILAADPMNQQELALATGISQQAISKILHDHPAVRHSAKGWRAQSVGDLLDGWTQEYPGTGGLPIHWYHLDPVTEQARLATEVAHELELVALATGDIAADSYAPWRLPALATIYVAETIDLTVADFVPADPGESTLVLQIPHDPTVWTVSKWYAGQQDKPTQTFVDPVLTLWDVMHSPGPDASDAAQALRESIVSENLRA